MGEIEKLPQYGCGDAPVYIAVLVFAVSLADEDYLVNKKYIKSGILIEFLV